MSFGCFFNGALYFVYTYVFVFKFVINNFETLFLFCFTKLLINFWLKMAVVLARLHSLVRKVIHLFIQLLTARFSHKYAYSLDARMYSCMLDFLFPCHRSFVWRFTNYSDWFNTYRDITLPYRWAYMYVCVKDIEYERGVNWSCCHPVL